MRFFQIFRRKATKDVRSLRIDGVKTTMTPQPDDAELAAQALLESMCDGRRKKEDGRKKNHEPLTMNREPSRRDAAYYRQLSEKIRQTRAADARLTMRYLTYCEEMLNMMDDGRGKMDDVLSDLEQGLYRHLTTAEREGGELLRRWQHCLAEVIVRRTPAASDTNTDLTDLPAER